MDREMMKKTMRTSISEVLEKMFFLPLDFSDAGTPAELWEDPSSADLIGARLSFDGPFTGAFLFLIPRRLGLDLTADFMGVEPDAVPPEHVEQTVHEILNMIAGSTFSALDDQAVFELGIPESIPAQTILASGREGVFVGVDTLESPIALMAVRT